MTKILNTRYRFDSSVTYKHIGMELELALERGIISERDKSLLERYQMKLEQTCCANRIQSEILVLKTARRFFKTDFQDADADEFEAAISRMHRGDMINTTDKKVKEYSRNYIVSIQSSVKRLFKWMCDKGLTTVSKKTINELKTGKFDLQTKTEGDVLTAEEINAIIETAKTPMYKAYFSLLYETGARSVEMANLKWSDLTYQEWGIQVRITDTKTDKMRSVPCITYAKYLYEWANHYNDGEPTGDKFVFLSNQKKPLRYNTVLDALERTVKAAGIQKKVTLHRFRHSRITHMLREGMSETVCKKAFWGNTDSHMIATYGHLTNKDVENEYLRIAGVEVADRKRDEAPKPVTCPTCLKVHPPGTRFCNECGTPLTVAGRKKQQSTQEFVDEQMTKFDTGDFVSYKEIAAKMEAMEKELKRLKAKEKREEEKKEEK